MAMAESKQGGARVRIPPPLVFLVANGAGLGLRYVVAPPLLPFARVVQLVVGGALAALAIALGLSALGLFKKSGPNAAPWTPSPSLLLEGPYRFTRNPMYVGMFVLTVGIGFLANNLWVVIAAVVFLLVVHFTAVLPEEAYLAEKFGVDYRRFKTKVRRYL
jgi:protein-S-isoprenylcysteine O-methyltransferase Ste14